MYSKEFKELVGKGVNEDFYIGHGNPNARILFVGKEAAIDSDDLQKNSNYLSNAQSWKTHIEKKTCEVLSYIPEDKALRMTGHTWRKYQKLHDYIYIKTAAAEDKYRIDFLENIFTTEMNDSPSKWTQAAQQKIDFKERLDKRRNTFFKSDFIKHFPVIILACGNYIRNDDKERQIDNTFGVEFITSEISQGLPFWIHLNKKKNKLVIHTRQLSSSAASNELLERIGIVVSKFMKENNI